MAEETFYRDQILCTFAPSNALLNANAMIARSKEYKETKNGANIASNSKRSSPLPRYLPHRPPRSKGRGQANLRSRSRKSLLFFRPLKASITTNRIFLSLSSEKSH